MREWVMKLNEATYEYLDPQKYILLCSSFLGPPDSNFRSFWKKMFEIVLVLWPFSHRIFVVGIQIASLHLAHKIALYQADLASHSTPEYIRVLGHVVHVYVSQQTWHQGQDLDMILGHCH